MLSVPTRDQLISHALRHLAGAALVVLAAAVVHRAGHVDQQWPYVAIAAALAAQIAVNLLALRERARRAALRVSGRPQLILLVASVALAATGLVTWVVDGITMPAVAALTAAAGLAIAGSPATIAFARRSA